MTEQILTFIKTVNIIYLLTLH